MDILDHLRGDLLPQHRIEAETSLEKWTRAKTDKGRTTHLATSRSFNLAYWQGYRAAILNLQDALNNAKDAGRYGRRQPIRANTEGDQHDRNKLGRRTRIGCLRNARSEAKLVPGR